MAAWRKLLRKNLDLYHKGWRGGKIKLYVSNVTIKGWLRGADPPEFNLFEPLLGIDDTTRTALLKSKRGERGKLILPFDVTAEIYQDFVTEYIEKTSALRDNLHILGEVDARSLYSIEDRAQRYAEQLRQHRLFLSIEGVGGIGKTSFAVRIGQLLRQITSTVLLQGEYPYNVIFCVRLEDNKKNSVPHARSREVLHPIATFLKLNIEKKGESPYDLCERIIKHIRATRQKCLFIIDNIETNDDIEEVLPHLTALNDWASIILTSRQQLAPHMPNRAIEVCQIAQLNKRDAHQLLTRELRNIGTSIRITSEESNRIYDFTGGNPHALLLVAHMIRDNFSYQDVLDALSGGDASQNGQGEARLEMEVMFHRIYETIWKRLSKPAKKLYSMLAMMPLSGMRQEDMAITIAGISKKDEISEASYRRALGQLRSHYLVIQSGKIQSLRYTMHPLTRSFIRSAFYKSIRA